MNSNSAFVLEDNSLYVLSDLQRLESEYRLRLASCMAVCRSAARKSLDSKAANNDSGHGFTGVAGGWFTRTISTKDKLRNVRERRVTYLQNRQSEGVVDFLSRLRSFEVAFCHVRDAEEKALSYWFRRCDEDYQGNWFVRCSPIRRYYESISKNLSAEPNVERLSRHLLALTPPSESMRHPRKLIFSHSRRE